MSDLGELLVLLHGARGRIGTVRATVRTWRDERLQREAFERSGDGWVAFGPVDREPAESESVSRVWLAPPDRAREERDEFIGVRRGGLWWNYDPVNGAISNENDREVSSGVGSELWWLLDPAPVMGVLDFDAIAPGRRAGRATLEVRARPRPSTEEDNWSLIRLGGPGADELRLAVDAERGALLRVEARIEGRAFSVAEVVEIAFDETFDDDVFVFTPPPGEEVRSPADHHGLEHDLTIEQAVARCPFTVWIPSRLPAGWESQMTFAAASERPPMAPQLHLHYRAPDGTHAIAVAQSPAGHPGEHSEYEHARAAPWREIARDGRPMQVREPAESWQPAQLLLELEGTRIHIHSTDLDAGALMDLAAGLVRAPAEPPSLG